MDTLHKLHAEYLSKLKVLFSRKITDEIDWSDRLIGIRGARGVGKSTLLLQYIKDNFKYDKNYLYASVDDLSFTERTIVGLAETFTQRGGKVLFLDKIHKYTNWSQELKNCYDRFPEIKIVFTGSSVLHILEGDADLSRRAVVYEMEGLSFREFINIETKNKFDFNTYSLTDIIENHTEIAIRIKEKIKPLKYFIDYLRFGYYPFFLENRNTYLKRLLSTIYLVLESDITILKNVEPRYIHKLKKLMYILSTRAPLQPNINNLSRDVGTSRETITKYMYYLSDGKLINLLHADRYKSMRKPDKVFLHNTNLMYAISPASVNKGNLRETFFFNQVDARHLVNSSKKGDFLIDEKYTFEIGGENKSKKQIQGIENAYIAADDIEIGFDQKIPLWLFGFLY